MFDWPVVDWTKKARRWSGRIPEVVVPYNAPEFDQFKAAQRQWTEQVRTNPAVFGPYEEQARCGRYGFVRAKIGGVGYGFGEAHANRCLRRHNCFRCTLHSRSPVRDTSLGS